MFLCVKAYIVDHWHRYGYIAPAMPKKEPKKGRKLYGLSVNPSLMLEVQRLALDMDRFVNDVMEEAMQDVLKKYRERKRTG
jgi:hypothetical protein